MLKEVNVSEFYGICPKIHRSNWSSCYINGKSYKKNHFLVQFDARPGVRNGPGLYLMWKVFEDSALMTASLAA